MRVCVAGAGPVGVNTALEVHRVLGKSAQVTVLADGFNQDTTGDGAAGFFLPSPYFTGPTADITRQWIRDSFDRYNDICFSSEAEPAGVGQFSGYIFSNASKIENRWLQDSTSECRPATEEELQLYPGGARFGTYCTTLRIECRYFLPWALNRLQENGASVKRGKVSNLADLAQDYDVVFNCTGLGAKVLCDDHLLVPLRGQVFKVTAPWIKTFTVGDNDTYIIPNREVVTLGGSRWFGNWNRNIDRHESESIWERCVQLVPSLAQARVQRQWVGLRPHRCPVRVEMENLNLSAGAPLKVVHNYGHGGYGIMSAPGTAKHAVSLLQDQQRASVGSSKL